MQANDLYGYICIYKHFRVKVYATSSYQAQLQAAKQFKVKKSYQVTVVLCERPNGEPVIHTTNNL